MKLAYIKIATDTPIYIYMYDIKIEDEMNQLNKPRQYHDVMK